MTNEKMKAAVITAAVAVVILAVSVVIYDILFEDNTPVSGRVAEKIEVYNGYGIITQVLKVEVAEGRFSYIEVSASVYQTAVVGAHCEFGGKKGGSLYSKVKMGD